MTVAKLIKILQDMPQSVPVRFIDYGSDTYPLLDIGAVRYTRGEGVIIAFRREDYEKR